MKKETNRIFGVDDVTAASYGEHQQEERAHSINSQQQFWFGNSSATAKHGNHQQCAAQHDQNVGECVKGWRFPECLMDGLAIALTEEITETTVGSQPHAHCKHNGAHNLYKSS